MVVMFLAYKRLRMCATVFVCEEQWIPRQVARSHGNGRTARCPITWWVTQRGRWWCRVDGFRCPHSPPAVRDEPDVCPVYLAQTARRWAAPYSVARHSLREYLGVHDGLRLGTACAGHNGAVYQRSRRCEATACDGVVGVVSALAARAVRSRALHAALPRF